MSFPGPTAIDDLPFSGNHLLCKSLVNRHWDDTLDGDRTNAEDLERFLDPFLNTIRLQQSQE